MQKSKNNSNGTTRTTPHMPEIGKVITHKKRTQRQQVPIGLPVEKIPDDEREALEWEILDMEKRLGMRLNVTKAKYVLCQLIELESELGLKEVQAVLVKALLFTTHFMKNEKKPNDRNDAVDDATIIHKVHGFIELLNNMNLVDYLMM